MNRRRQRNIRRKITMMRSEESVYASAIVAYAQSVRENASKRPETIHETTMTREPCDAIVSEDDAAPPVFFVFLRNLVILERLFNRRQVKIISI